MSSDARLANIPQELRDRPQWVCWRREMRGGKLTKVPHVAAAGHKHADSTDPATWRTFEEACEHAGRFDGIGFVFAADDPYCGIDLDHAIDPGTGEVHPDALAILRALPSYTETSPSGTGLHILCRTTLPDKGTKKPRGSIDVEMYDRGRYFTVTGARWADSPASVADCQTAAANLYAELKSADRKTQPAPRRAEPLTLTDQELLERARNAKNGAIFAALFDHGDMTGYSGASEADRALCALLNFWTGNNPDHTERLARQSALCRPKWDERRGDTTWIRREIESTYQAETYNPNPHINQRINGQTPEPGAGQPDGDNSMDAQTQARETIDAAIEAGTASAVLDDPEVLAALAALPPGERTDRQQAIKKAIPAIDLRQLRAAIPSAKNGHGREGRSSLPLADQHLTDLGNARRLVTRHGADIRHDHQRGLWLIWDGRRWSPDDTSEITRRAKDTVAAMYKEAATLRSDSDRQAVVKHALQSEGRNAITNMIVLAASEPGVPVLAAHTDADPWLFNCQNGTIDLRTGELREHRREDLITKLAPVEYDPEATHPMWDDLLDRVTRGDSDTRAYLQKAAGYTLTGSTREDKAFCLVSEGGGGKTSFLEPIVKTMGGYATIAEDNTFVAQHAGASGHSEDVAALAGARLVICTEMGRGKLAEERFKRMTGGDSIRASRKHERSFEFTPQFKLWMAMNRALRADDEDTGVWRRLRYIPWLPIPEDERDPRVKETLLRDTAARKAILAWMVAGCRAYLSDGLGDPPAVIAATEHRREENNPMAAFFDDCCVFGAEMWTPARALRDAYDDWCKETGARPVHLGDWGRRLHERGAESARDRLHGRHWRGIGLLTFERGVTEVTVRDSASPLISHDSSHEGEKWRSTDTHCHHCHADGVKDGSDAAVEIVEEEL